VEPRRVREQRSAAGRSDRSLALLSEEGTSSARRRSRSPTKSKVSADASLAGSDSKGAAAEPYPGWYAGRAVHIHVKVHLGTDETHTGQLFFEDDVTAAV
jgi:hypothetical protein